MRFVPRWRKMTWVITIFTVLMIAWAIAGASSESTCSPGDSACKTGEDIGTGIGVALLFFLWFIGFIILSIIWFMTRPKGRRECPTCGRDVKKGETVCNACGYDFRLRRNPEASAPGGVT